MSAVVGSEELRVKSEKFVEPGVMFILKNRNNAVNIDRKNLLHPFYMVYLKDDGSVICDHLSPKRLLDTMRHVCKGKSQPDKALCRAFNAETKDGRRMNHYSDLLHSAIDSIITVKEESDLNSFLKGASLSFADKTITGLDDFELITFLVIK